MEQKIGIGLAADTPLSVSDVVECARFAERKALDALWVAEGRAGEAFSTLTAVALHSDGISLGAGIIPVFTRSPWLIAMGTAVVDEISKGRFTLGLGPSHKSVVEQRHGLVFDKPLQRLRETASIVRLALRGEAVTYEGETFNIQGAQLSCKPRRPDVPIYVAAMRPRMLQLAGEIADGVFLIFPTLTYVKAALEEVREGARRAGRLSRLRVGPLLCMVDSPTITDTSLNTGFLRRPERSRWRGRGMTPETRYRQ